MVASAPARRGPEPGRGRRSRQRGAGGGNERGGGRGRPHHRIGDTARAGLRRGGRRRARPRRSGSGSPGTSPTPVASIPRCTASRPWTMRQYAGFATAEETNARFRYLLAAGAPGLSTAFDLPTQLGMDSDDPLAAGEVGRVGVAIDSVEDMAPPVRRHPARPGLHEHDDQRPRGRAAAAVPARGRGERGRPGGPAGHDPERRAQGVRRPRQLHLPAGARRCG